MFERVQKIVAEGLSVNESEITLETTFESLGADSLDLMELVMSFEEEFGVEIDTDEIANLKTIGDVVEYIQKIQK